MEALRPPAPLQFSLGKVKEKRRKWRQELENYLLAKFELPESKANYSEVLQKFEDYWSPRQNVVYERYKFLSCVQLEGQTIESYVTHLKTLASTCEFAEQENGLIRDCIVLGIYKDSGLQERLLRENNLSLEKAIEIVRAAEASREQIRNMKYETATINFVKKKEIPNRPKKSSQYECKKCGRKHKPRECPAFGKICTKCNKKNHFVVKCFQNTKNIHEMNNPENKLDVYILDSITVNETKYMIR
ncbi:transposon Ty3-G Gag-Pol polyprotein [Nephila pilipes]|uniref:Transposon Ty3-G Gag-Pol polyprotein n=1 Tax=Nephila pilipes TaxID=299642 RepID=A0A8X6IF87_NEPPI|nr:transposon Ty3-G Gag-Pol polyprotein [Nephila pilipes]